MGDTMRIRELIAQKNTREIITILPDQSLLDTARILSDHNIGALLVTDNEDKVAGVVSERDLVRAMAEYRSGAADKTVNDVMTRSVISCDPNDKIVDVMEIMSGKNIRHIPVLEDGRLKAMLSIRDFDHAYKRLQSQALTDELTGVSNRRHFLEILDQEFNRYRRFQTPLSVAVIQIDNFERINETYGQTGGDKVLCHLAELLSKDLRTFDGLGRIGGEEFAIAFPSTEMRKTERACERLLATIRSAEVVTENGSIRFTASAGVTEAHSETRDINDIMKQAEANLGNARSSGQDQVIAAAGKQDSGPDRADQVNGNYDSAAA